MNIETKQQLAERAFFLNENIKKCVMNIRDNYIELGFYAIELKKGKLYQLLMPEAKTWEMFVNAQPWGLKRASLDNYCQVALTIGNEIEGRDIGLNRALDITRIVNRLPGPEREQKISELIESAETLPKLGWEDTIRMMNGQVPSDECRHENRESWERCVNCFKFFKL